MSNSEIAAFLCTDNPPLLRHCALAEFHDQWVIKQLTRIRNTPKKPDFQELQEFAETARDIVEDPRRALKQALEALDRHTALHRL